MGSSDPGTLIHNAPLRTIVANQWRELCRDTAVGVDRMATGSRGEKTTAAQRARGKTLGAPYKTGIMTSPAVHENSEFETQV